MSDLIWLTEARMRRIEPYFPLSHGVPRVDHRRAISGIVFWRRIHTRYDRCVHTFSAIAIAATVICWLPQCALSPGPIPAAGESGDSIRCGAMQRR